MRKLGPFIKLVTEMLLLVTPLVIKAGILITTATFNAKKTQITEAVKRLRYEQQRIYDLRNLLLWYVP